MPQVSGKGPFIVQLKRGEVVEDKELLAELEEVVHLLLVTLTPHWTIICVLSDCTTEPLYSLSLTPPSSTLGGTTNLLDLIRLGWITHFSLSEGKEKKTFSVFSCFD